jgi:hypothetical protein
VVEKKTPERVQRPGGERLVRELRVVGSPENVEIRGQKPKRGRKAEVSGRVV